MPPVKVAPNPVRDDGHSHVVGFYDNDLVLVSTVAALFTDAFERNGSAIVVATPEHRRALGAALESSGHALDELTRTGRYRAVDADAMLTAFMVDGRPDARAFRSVIGGLLRAAGASGRPVQVFGEMVARLWDRGNLDGAIALEALWNDIVARHDVALMCAYTLSSLEASGDLAAAKRVCDAHSSLVPLDDDPGARPLAAATLECNGVDHVFVATPMVVRRVRRFVRQVARAAGEERALPDLEVVASELATNAVVHARSPFRVSISLSPLSIRIAVRDASFDRPELLDAGAGRVGGRGVRLVAAFSQAWGVDDEADGKTVWAEIAR